MGNQAGIIIRNVKNELFHSAKRLILNEVKGIECLLKKTYPVRSTEKEEPAEGFVPLAVTEEPVPALEWAVEHLVLRSPKGDVLEIKSTSLFVVAELLHKMS